MRCYLKIPLFLAKREGFVYVLRIFSSRISSPKNRSGRNSPSRREATAGEYFSLSVSGSKLVLMIMGRLAIRRLLIRLYSAETVKAVPISVPISSIMSRSARS